MIYCCVCRSIYSNVLVSRELVYVKDEDEKKSLLDTNGKIDLLGCEKSVFEMNDLDFMKPVNVTQTTIGCIAIIREEDSNGVKAYSKHDLSIEDVEEFLERGCEVILLNLTLSAISKFPNCIMKKIYPLKEHVK